MIERFSKLFNRVVRVRFAGGRALLDMYDVDGGGWQRFSSGRTTPLIAPGGAPLAAEIVVLAGDPPDPVSFGGDYVWLRRYQPNFTVGPDGDVTMVEGT